MPEYGLASMGSGSRGNGTLIRLGGTSVLVDCGFTLKDSEARLQRLGISAAALDAILVTHEHSDHIQGVARLARRYGTPVYLTHGTLQSRDDWKDVDVRPFNAHQPFRLGGVEIDPVPVPHDAREPVQFVLSASEGRIGVLTDLGHITDVVRTRFAGCTALLVEANHDLHMLLTGSYPDALKRRISSSLGHLSNAQTAAFLSEIDLPGDCALVIGHVSEQNNAMAALEQSFAAARAKFPRLQFATQSQGTYWAS
ncbi:MAG: MBL fold metallo-hydrolase [Gammaproteobacteria bacterium]|nr:MBL fold metallo-hydrolase [Gammaproteobacteria bacterium]